MPKKKIAETEPVVAAEPVLKPAAKPVKTTSKARAPRASAKAVTHKHKKTTLAALPAEPFTAGPVPSRPAAPVAEPTHEDIARLAYSYWEARGCQGGSQDEDWLRAVAELRRQTM